MGILKRILLGTGSVRSDDPHTITPDTDLIEAINVNVGGGLIEKEGGSRRWNTTALPAGVVALYDWRPTDIDAFIIAVTGDGRVWRYYNPNTRIEITAFGDAPETLTIEKNWVHIVEGGAEKLGQSKKLFILTGNDPVQVITALGTTRKDLSNPAADWADGNHPSFAVVVHSKMVMFGNKNLPHMLYGSNSEDHENFITLFTLTSVFPGDGEKLVSAFSYRGRLFCLKEPIGAFSVHEAIILDPWADLAGQPAMTRHTLDLGVKSPQCWIGFRGDVLIATATGEVVSLAAAANFQDVKLGNILAALRCEDIQRNQIDKGALEFGRALYDPENKRAYFAYRGAGALENNRIMVIDGSSIEKIKVTWTLKDQPTCFALIKNRRGIQQAFYGADDGYLYQMNTPNRDVNGVGYIGKFVTPYLNLVDPDPNKPKDDDITKNLKRLRVGYEGTGDWNLYVTPYVDGREKNTLTFNLKGRATLGLMRLDQDLLDEQLPLSRARKLTGSGKRISFACWNDGVGENFRILYLKVYCGPGGHRETEGG